MSKNCTAVDFLKMLRTSLELVSRSCRGYVIVWFCLQQSAAMQMQISRFTWMQVLKWSLQTLSGRTAGYCLGQHVAVMWREVCVFGGLVWECYDWCSKYIKCLHLERLMLRLQGSCRILRRCLNLICCDCSWGLSACITARTILVFLFFCVWFL